MKRIDLTGNKFNRWLVLKYSQTIKTKPYYLCRCDCGKEKEVRGENLINGLSKSCGCLKLEKIIEISRDIERRRKISIAKTGKKRPEFTGSKHPNWKGGISDPLHILRTSGEYKRFTNVNRKNYCEICGRKQRDKEKRLHLHHKMGVRDYPNKIFEEKNTLTLCSSCHQMIHVKKQSRVEDGRFERK